jgi:hypothetical protein
MNRTTFVSIAAVVSLANGIPGLIAPAATASLYGVTIDAQTALVAQLLAASYVGYAVINWTTRAATDLAMRRGLDAGNAVAWSISAVLWFYAASSGMTNAFGWFGVALTIAFAVGWAYFVVADRAAASPIVTTTRRA